MKNTKKQAIRKAYAAATIYTPGGSKMTPRPSRIAEHFKVSTEAVNKVISKL